MITKAWSAWCRFWFESNAPLQMALMRTLVGAIGFLFYASRTPDLMYFFSDSGLMPLEVMYESMPMQYRLSLMHHFSSDAAVWAFHAAFLGCLLLLAAGFWTRLVAPVALVLHISFVHRDMASVYGFDLVVTFLLLYLSFAELRPGRDPRSISSQLGSVAFRLSQLQICVIYAYSGLEKVKGTRWWKGEAVWDVLANAQLARWDFSAASSVPLLIMLATWMTLAWEIYFPALIWNRKLRYPMLAFGVMLHVGIGVTMSIPFFGAVMILSYSLFLEEKHAARVLGFGRNLFRRRRAVAVSSLEPQALLEAPAEERKAS